MAKRKMNSEIPGVSGGSGTATIPAKPKVRLPATAQDHVDQAAPGSQTPPVDVGEIDHPAAKTQNGHVDLASPSVSLDSFKKMSRRKTDGGEGQRSAEAQRATAVSADLTPYDCPDDPVLHGQIKLIRSLWQDRQTLVKQQVATVLRVQAYCRILCAGDRKEAEVLYKAVQGKGEHTQQQRAFAVVVPMLLGNQETKKAQAALEKQLEKLVRDLPGASYMKEAKGVGPISFAGIIGESGNLSNYKNPGKLWKRMGVSVLFDGRRQRRVKGVSEDEARAIGYVAERRSLLYVMGTSIIKAVGPLKVLYDERKAFELVKTQAIAEDPAKRKLFTSPEGGYAPLAHAHNRAIRYVEKRVLRDLWMAWRRDRGEAVGDPETVWKTAA